jgi:hypothetical protein
VKFLNIPTEGMNYWIPRRLWQASVAVWLLDVLSVVFFYSISAMSVASGDGPAYAEGSWGRVIGEVWSWVHIPIRSLVEPTLFGVLSSHPESPGALVFLLFVFICTLQTFFGVLLFGMLLMLAVRLIFKWRRPSESE